MNGVPKDIDLSSLYGKMVEQVCFSRYQVILYLEDQLFISLEGAFSFEDSLDAAPQGDYLTFAKQFTELLENHVEKAGAVRDDLLVIRFSNGTVLELFDSNERYESFQIQLPDKLVVV